MVDLPLRGAPTTAAWPAAPDRSTQSGSRRCSNGRSTIPVTARSLPRQSGLSTAHPYSLRDRQRRQQLVERGRHVQRRQPDLVRGQAVPDELADDGVEQALRAAPARLSPALRLVVDHLGPDVAGAVGHDHRPQPALEPCGPGRVAGPETYAALNRVMSPVSNFR